MPSKIALLLCVAYVLLLFYMDHRRKPRPSSALWIPLLWMFFIGSRFPAQWLRLEIPEGYDVSMEGSPMDRNVFTLLIILGALILYRRRVQVRELIRQNKWAAAFFIFAFISILWADFPLISIKRWIKSTGNVVMVLVILSDPHPKEAFAAALRRCSFVLVPFSVLLIKWFPVLGRSYAAFHWSPIYIGVTTNKNALGAVCVVAGVFCFWDLIHLHRLRKQGQAVTFWILTNLFFMAMVLWLLNKAQSSTSLFCFLLGIIIVLAFNTRAMQSKARHMEALVIVSVIVFFILQVTIGVSELVVESLGRDTTLTGRTDIWRELIPLVENPLLGAGYESFWLSGRKDILWEKIYWKPNQAHNGYIETYLHLGLIGLFLLAGLIVSAFKKIKNRLMVDGHDGSLYLAFFIYTLLSNITEATFKGINLIFFLFLFVSLEYVHHTEVQASSDKSPG